MYNLVFFGLVLIVFLRILGLGISLDLWFDLRSNRYTIIVLGWLAWIIGGILPIISDSTEDSNLSESLLVANAILAALGTMLVVLGIMLYFLQIPPKLIGFLSSIMIMIPVLLFILIDHSVAIAFSSMALFSVGVSIFIVSMLKRDVVREFIGKSIKWLDIGLAFSIFYLTNFCVMLLSGVSFGLYESKNDTAILVHYFFAIGLTIFFIVLFIHFEYGISYKQRYQLKDKYSHDLGNIIQTVVSATSLVSMKTSLGEEESIKLKLVQNKCDEAANLIKEIRKL